MEVTKANLATYLSGLTPSATPYPIEITETVASDWGTSKTAGTVGNIINTNTPSGVYLDLGFTVIPNSVTDMTSTFYGCISLTTAPVIPSSVTNMYYTFYGCTSLTTAPIIPNSTTSMPGTFSGCTSLTTAPVIPSSVTNMSYTFLGCTSLTTAPIIPSSVTNMYYTFFGCTLLHTIQNFAVDVDNCDMTEAFRDCPALANIYVTTLSESSWHLLHTDTDATGTDYTIYNPDGTVAGSGTVAGTSQVLTLYGKSDELVISANITPTLAEETATTQVQWHKSGLPYDDELMIFNAKNPDTVISNFITVNRAGEEFLGNSATATTAQTATLATQANAIKPLGNSITLSATPTSVTKIIKIATVNWGYAGTINIRCNGSGIIDVIKIYHSCTQSSASGTKVLYSKVNNTTYGIKKIVVTSDTSAWDSNRQIYAEIQTYANSPSTTTIGVVETNYGTLTPSMTEVASVEGTVIDSLPLSYRRGDISSYQHVFTKNIIGNGVIETIRTSSPFSLSTYSDGKQLRIANTHATNTITCTLPTGQTMNGQTSFTIIAKKIIELELIGTVWVDTNNDYYSTTEQVIGKWIDGKPIYRKVINFGTLPNTTNKNVAHGISNLDKTIRLYGTATDSTQSLPIPNVYSTDPKYIIALWQQDKTNIFIKTEIDRTAFTAFVFIEYTKTTD